MKIPRKVPGGEPRPEPDAAAAAEDAAGSPTRRRQRSTAAPASTGTRSPGTAVDRAALTLCRLRRARAGLRGTPEHGDEAVRAALDGGDPEAVVWLASRAISYLDETGFPDAVELWFPDDVGGLRRS